MPRQIQDVNRLDVTRGSRWRSATGEMAVVINRWHNWDTKEATNIELYLWNAGTFKVIDASVFCQQIEAGNYTRI